MKRTLSRVITAVLVLAMVIAMLPVSASALTWDNVSETRYASRYYTSDYATGKFYKNMTQIPLTGDGRRDVVAVAASQVGYIEGDSSSGYDGETGGSGNYTEYGQYMGLTGAWCAAFCAWTFYTAEVTDVDGYYYDTGSGNIWADVYVPDWSNYLINQGRYKAAYQFKDSYSDLYDASYIPQPGDLVFFYTASGDYPGWEGHIGLVAYSDGTYVYTLEGNTSSQDGVESEGGGMFFKKYSLTGSNLVGFGSMPYESVDGLPEIDYTGANPTTGLYVTVSGAKSVYQNINDSTASWTLPMSSVFEVKEISTASDGTVMLYSKCEINGTTVYGWIPHGSDSNGLTKTLQIYSNYDDPNDLDKDGIRDSYLPSIDDEGNYVFDNAYGHTFKIDDVNGSIGGEDATLITSASAYESCNPNWAISVQLRPTGNDGEYSVVKVVTTPGSAAAAGITLEDGDVILVVHSADSKPGTYANWKSKVAAIALKEGDVLSINDAQTSATVLSSGEPVDPPVTEPEETEPEETEPEETEPEVTEPEATEPVEVPDFGGAIDGAGQQGYTGNLYYGVDISYHNVNDQSYHDYETDDDSGADYSLLDFAAMKASGLDYVIIRIGSQDTNGIFYDPHFITMYNMAREAGMDVGAYFYSHALTYDEAVAEAQFCIDVIEDNGMYFDYPVYIDIEEEDQLALSTTELDAIAYGWCETMAEAGYFPGIYTGYYASQTMSTQLKSDYDMWIASYDDGVTPENDNLSAECSMWQYTSTGTGGFAGIGKDDIDLNICYKDYPAIMAAGGYNNYGETTEPDPSEPTEPDVTEPTEPEETEPTEPEETEPEVEIPDYGGAIAGAGIPGSADNLAEGCDVSFYNVNDQSYANYTTSDDSGADYSLLDFEAMKADGCDFVILRMGSSDSSGYYTDPHFFTLYDMAREAGLDIGLYFYSYALTEAEAIAEANYVISVLDANDMYFEYPIYIDIEESDQLALSETVLSNVCYGWCETMYNAGYFPGIYGNYNLYDAISTQVKNDYDFWLAYVSSATSMSAYNPSNTNLSNECAMWQYSFYGYEYDGVGLDMLDVNVAYKDYPAIMKAYGYNNYEKEIKIPESYNPTQDAEGNYSFDNAYGYVFNIDDVNGTIEGEDSTLIESSTAYESCHPNWAISLQLRPNGHGQYEVVKVVSLPGSAANAGITMEDGDKVLVVHSSASKPGQYDNWMSKVAAMAVKPGDIIEISSDNTTATVLEPADVHTFVAGEYTWTEDYDVCSVVGTCSCDLTADANTTVITSEETVTGTCKTPAEVTYTAVFAESWAQDQTKTVTGGKDSDNHESDELSCTDNEDGATHTKAHKCCGTAIDTEEAHEYENGECVCGAEKPADAITVIEKGGIEYEAVGNVVTVSHPAPCKVGYWDAENNKYVAIKAQPNEDGTYSFTAPEGVTEVLVVVKGDINGDGKITVVDRTFLARSMLGTDNVNYKPLTEAWEIFAADITGDGKITVADRTFLARSMLGTDNVNYKRLTW